MAESPTYASLLTRLFSVNPEERTGALQVLEQVSESDRFAVESDVRARLRDTNPGMRLIAAEIVFRIYSDTPAAVDAMGMVMRCGEPAIVADAAGAIRRFGIAATPLLVQMVRHAPEVFATQTTAYHRWAAECVLHSGPEGVALWLEIFDSARGARPALLLGLAQTAPAVTHDLSALELPLRVQYLEPAMRAAAGAALWRITWRVNGAWLASIRPGIGDGLADIRELLLEVLIEHLGRRPDLAELVRANLITLAEANPGAGQEFVSRLARLGSLGWAVLIPLLQPPEKYPFQDTIFAVALNHPVVLPLIHHHARAAILAAQPNTGLCVLAVLALAKLGPAAGMAVSDLLDLAVRAPSMATTVAEALPKLAAGYPNTPAAIVRALNRLRSGTYFGADHLTAFQALGASLAQLDLELGPRLVDNTVIYQRTVELLLQQPSWKEAGTETRARHCRVLADALGSARAEVRLRAAELLRLYRNELPAVWPSLMAALTTADELTANAVLLQFRFLDSIADTVTPELLLLFREPNPIYAARAVIAMWRLGGLAYVGAELRRSIEDTPDGWGWAVLRAVVDRVSQTHGILGELCELFAASPATIAEKVAALVNPPEAPEDHELITHIPRAGDPTAPATVVWNSVKNVVNSEGASGQLFFLALMCEYGPQGWNTHKIWMIKGYREITRASLGESKQAVERIVELLECGDRSVADRRRAVRDYFAGRVELPSEVVAMLEHRLSWLRWAGLELADAWGLTLEQAKEVTAERVWDTSPRVRERALRVASRSS